MISIVQEANCYRYRGLAKDKPLLNVEKLTNGSTFFAMDEDKTYMFDGSSKQWLDHCDGMLPEEERLA